MRLGQLARKVNTKPAQIISFLEKEHNITIEENLNSKIEDDSLTLVLEAFKIEEKIVVEPKEEEVLDDKEVEIPVETILDNNITDEVSSDTVDAFEAVEEVKIETSKEEDYIKTETFEQEITEEEPVNVETEKLIVIDEDGEEIELNVVDGIIKAPKKELEGFKVVGKIDLPNKKKAVIFIHTKGDESVDVTEKIDKQKNDVALRKKELYLERKKKRQDRSITKKRTGRKVLTELELKEKSNKLAVEKQIQKTKVNKAAKNKHYKDNVQSKSTKKKTKKKKNTPSEKTQSKYDTKPTSTWGKLMKWFNT